jgi:hypothetical protein
MTGYMTDVGDGSEQLEGIVRDLVEQRNDAVEGSPAHRMATRQLQGIRKTELGELIIQDYEMRAKLFLPVA